MPRECYQAKRFSKETRAVIDQANSILATYAQQGHDVTLRQLYYQFVTRELIPNNLKQYKRLGAIINDARMAGEIDWNAIVDRTRNLRSPAFWSSPRDILEACAQQFRLDMWFGQPHRPEVWVEKDALIGVVEKACGPLRVPFFSCRGYTSQSEMWGAAQRLLRYLDDDQRPYIIHLGDHDPSGVDMTRDIEARLRVFMGELGGELTVERVALNMPQIEKLDLPPNPAKVADSRAEGYIARYGADSWELDALSPPVLTTIIKRSVLAIRDEELWASVTEDEEEQRGILQTIADRWDRVRAMCKEELCEQGSR